MEVGAIQNAAARLAAAHPGRAVRQPRADPGILKLVEQRPMTAAAPAQGRRLWRSARLAGEVGGQRYHSGNLVGSSSTAVWRADRDGQTESASPNQQLDPMRGRL